MDEDKLRQKARERLRDMPAERRARLLAEARRRVLNANPGVPPSEIRVEGVGVGLDALAEELAVRVMARMLGDIDARLKEHVVEEDIRRWIAEEEQRLVPEYPDGVPDDAIVDAVLARMDHERPQAG